MNVLITGTSGSGKSAVGQVFRERGFHVIDADHDAFQGMRFAYFKNKASGKPIQKPNPTPKHWSFENDWVWRVQLIQRRLAAGGNQTNFVVGDSRNKEEAYRLFDTIFVLSTDDDTLRQRIHSRQDNHFGKDPEEFAWIMEQNKRIATEVSQAGGVVIDAAKPLNEVVEEILNQVKASTS